jgi:hypothetical protein
MDCSIVPSKKYPDMSIISTTDFFFPLVESPYEQGRIACTNVVSDMYALGVVDIDNILMLIAASLDMPVPVRGMPLESFLSRVDYALYSMIYTLSLSLSLSPSLSLSLSLSFQTL